MAVNVNSGLLKDLTFIKNLSKSIVKYANQLSEKEVSGKYILISSKVLHSHK